MKASSYVEIPQTVGGHTVYMGMYTLDTPSYVPVLIGIKTLTRLGAVVDFQQRQAVFRGLNSNVVPLIHCNRTSHLLIDLARDWTSPDRVAVYTAVDLHLDWAHGIHEVEEEEDVSNHDQQEWSELFGGEHADDDPCSPQPMCAQNEQGSALASVPDPLLDGNELSDGQERRQPDARDQDGMRRESQDGQEQEGEAAGVGEVRLCQRGGTGPEGSTMPRGSLLRPARDHALLQGEPERQECSRSLADMREMPIEDILRASVWGPCSPSPSGTPLLRRPCPVGGEVQRDCGEPGGAECDHGGHGRCGEKPGEQVGRGEKEERGIEAESQSQGGCGYYHSYDEEDDQARGNGDGGGAGILGGWRVEEGACFGEVKVTSGEEKAKLVCSIKDAVASVEEVLRELEGACMMAKTPPVDLIEVCCPPDSSLSGMVEEMGGTVIRICESHMNLATRDGLMKAEEVLRREKPRWMWVSFPCGPTSSVQALNERTEEMKVKSMMRKKKSRRLVRRSMKLLYIHVFEHGGHLAWEWPQSNQGWWFPEVQQFFKDVENHYELYRTILHGCRVGVRAHDGGLMKKPWKIFTTSQEMASALDLQCTKDHKHSPCLGSDNTKRSAFYTEKMVKIISRVILKDHGRQAPGIRLKNMDGHDNNVANLVDILEDAEEEFIGAVDDQSIPKEEKTEIPEGLSEQQWAKVREVVRKLHVRAGHPSNIALVNSLKARGGSAALIEAARTLQCDDCLEARRSHAVSKASFSRANTLWHTLQMDIGQFKYKKKILHVLFLVDEASTFVVPHLIGELDEDKSMNASAEQVVEALQASWEC